MWTECGHICGVVHRTACNAIRMAERPAWCQMEARRTRLRMRRQRPRAAGRSARARTRWRSPLMESHAAGQKNGGRHATRSGQAVCHTQWAPPTYIYIYIYMCGPYGQVRTNTHPGGQQAACKAWHTVAVQHTPRAHGGTHSYAHHAENRAPQRAHTCTRSAMRTRQRAAGHSRAQSTAPTWPRSAPLRVHACRG